jgi:hypothetical protein
LIALVSSANPQLKSRSDAQFRAGPNNIRDLGGAEEYAKWMKVENFTGWVELGGVGVGENRRFAAK